VCVCVCMCACVCLELSIPPLVHVLQVADPPLSEDLQSEVGSLNMSTDKVVTCTIYEFIEHVASFFCEVSSQTIGVGCCRGCGGWAGSSFCCPRWILCVCSDSPEPHPRRTSPVGEREMGLFTPSHSPTHTPHTLSRSIWGSEVCVVGWKRGRFRPWLAIGE
jgi:hypothetical protein